jgi:hypothetical protein
MHLGYLTDLNRNVEGVLTLLEKLAEYPELNNEDFIIFQSYFREYLADTNMMVLDALEESEQETMLKANKERVSYEKRIRDPDDCYFDVRNREEELRAQGLPSQFGILRGMRRVTTKDILEHISGELRLEGTLWAVFALSNRSAVAVFVELLFEAPGNDLLRSIGDRLVSIEPVLVCYGTGVPLLPRPRERHRGLRGWRRSGHRGYGTPCAIPTIRENTANRWALLWRLSKLPTSQYPPTKASPKESHVSLGRAILHQQLEQQQGVQFAFRSS